MKNTDNTEEIVKITTILMKHHFTTFISEFPVA